MSEFDFDPVGRILHEESRMKENTHIKFSPAILNARDSLKLDRYQGLKSQSTVAFVLEENQIKTHKKNMKTILSEWLLNTFKKPRPVSEQSFLVGPDVPLEAVHTQESGNSIKPGFSKDPIETCEKCWFCEAVYINQTNVKRQNALRRERGGVVNSQPRTRV